MKGKEEVKERSASFRIIEGIDDNAFNDAGKKKGGSKIGMCFWI